MSSIISKAFPAAERHQRTLHNFFQPRCAQKHLVPRFVDSTVTDWYLHRFISPVPISFGRSCQKGCKIVDRQPLTVFLGRTSMLYTRHVQLFSLAGHFRILESYRGPHQL